MGALRNLNRRMPPNPGRISSLWREKNASARLPQASHIINRKSFVFGKSKRKIGMVVNWVNGIQTCWAYLPRRAHMPIFAASQAKLHQGGIGSSFPGAVGFISVVRSRPESATINEVHGNFTKGNVSGMTSSLSSRYFHWKRLLFESIFHELKSGGVRIVYFEPERRNLFDAKIFEEIAKGGGFAVTASGLGLTARL